MPPMAAASAEVEPDTPEKKISAMMTTCPSPPGRCPTSDRASVTRRRLIPPTSMRKPARMKRGTASMGKESMPGDDLLRDDDEGEIRRHDGDRGRGREREADGHRSQHQGAEDAEEEAAHQPVSLGRVDPLWPRECLIPPQPASRWMTISTPETGTLRRKQARSAGSTPRSALPW